MTTHAMARTRAFTSASSQIEALVDVRGRNRVYGDCLNAHYAHNLCVAAIYNDVRREVRYYATSK